MQDVSTVVSASSVTGHPAGPGRRAGGSFAAALFVVAAGAVAAPGETPDLASAASPGDASPEATGLEAGRWAASLTCPGGEIRFDLELTRGSSGAGSEAADWSAWIRNGRERVQVPSVRRIGEGELVLDFTHYGSAITATIEDEGRRLTGTWQRRRGADLWTRMPFSATWAEPTITFGRGLAVTPSAGASAFAGRWAVDFSSSDELAVGVFEADPRDPRGLAGTFLTTVGDYRFLGGTVEDGGNAMRLQVFDGAHAFLFTAVRRPDGTLAGDFWSRDAWHETWTARRDPEAALPDGFGLTAWNPEVALGDLRFPAPDGELVALDDPRFAGRPRIIEVFGTWCPNCNDATEFLVELDRRYRDRGLSILGLAFEYTGDFAVDAERVRAYRDHHQVRFPILIAGTADKARASTALPILDRVRAYPTLIFIDRDGTVRAIYTGFNGPATGPLHAKLREDVERIIESMLP